MKKKISIVSDSEKFSVPDTIKPVKPEVISAVPISESLPDDEIDEVFQRAAEIDELTIQFISDLMGIDESVSDCIMEMIDPQTLSSIEDEFESILAENGFIIYRPTIIDGENGKEKIVPSIYDGDV